MKALKHKLYSITTLKHGSLITKDQNRKQIQNCMSNIVENTDANCWLQLNLLNLGLASISALAPSGFTGNYLLSYFTTSCYKTKANT